MLIEPFMISNGKVQQVLFYVMIVASLSGGLPNGIYDHCLHALTMEALDCRDGLAMALQLGIQKVWLESDCQEVVRLWQARDQQRSSVWCPS